ncbi:MAG TPA: abortive infection family protein [Solirubrobacterales bacterium]|nr:abortive infection family protein [Solirubrobacterales bacterium]
MANHLDFLTALDDHVRVSPLGVVPQGAELHTIAREAGLVEPGVETAARWTGQLVNLGFVKHGPKSFGDPRPLPVGDWTPQEVYRFNDYMVTSTGHSEADAVRRRRREELTDASLGAIRPVLLPAWMSEAERRAVGEPLGALRAALDGGRGPAAVGASKDLIEASCKVVIARGGMEVEEKAALPRLFKLAHGCVAGTDEVAGDLGRSLAATVQRVAELRNSAGAGHGHAAPPQVGTREARLAAVAASGLSAYLLSAWR